MANHASALKAHRQSEKRREHNRELRGRLRAALKSIRGAIADKDATAAQAAWRGTASVIDKMAQKGVIHKNAAGRYKSRLATKLAAMKY